MIEYMKIKSRNKIWEHKFNKIDFFHSSGKNSQGKTTIIRSILYSLGFINNNNYVDGAKVLDLIVETSFLLNQNNYKFVRSKKAYLILKNKEIFFQKQWKLSSKDFKKIFKILSNIFFMPFSSVTPLLFSHVIDQNFGSKVLNRGKIGVFPSFLEFNINSLLVSMEEDASEIERLEKAQKTFTAYKKDLSFIKAYTNKIPKEISIFDFSEDEVNLENLKIEASKLNILKKIKIKRNTLMKAFEYEIGSMNLTYKDDNGNIKKLNAKNFKASLTYNKKILQNEVKIINSKIKTLKTKIENAKVKTNKYEKEFPIKLKQIQSMRAKIIKSLIKVNQDDVEIWSESQIGLQKIIDDCKKKSKMKSFNKINNHFIKFLLSFIDVNPDIGLFVEKLKNFEKGKDEYSKFLITDILSKFTTYVGAIRLIITYCLKFAIAKYLKESGVEFPIIIDSLNQEEIDENVENKFIEIIKKEFASDQIIITSLKDKNIFGTKDIRIVQKDIFNNGDIKQFFDSK